MGKICYAKHPLWLRSVYREMLYCPSSGLLALSLSLGFSMTAFGKINSSASRRARSMMGQLSSGQERLFYSFNLEDHIPASHLLRSIDQWLDLSDLRHWSALMAWCVR